jgi:hypothetical protein
VDRVDADRRRDIGEREGFGQMVVQQVAGLTQPSRRDLAASGVSGREISARISRASPSMTRSERSSDF